MLRFILHREITHIYFIVPSYMYNKNDHIVIVATLLRYLGYALLISAVGNSLGYVNDVR